MGSIPTRSRHILKVRKMKITHYSFGKITVDGVEYQADLIVFPDSVYKSWWRKEGHSLCLEDLEEVLKRDVEILIVGTGAYGKMKVPEELKSVLKSKGIEVKVFETDRAVKEFNTLIEQHQKVAGAFHLTC